MERNIKKKPTQLGWVFQSICFLVKRRGDERCKLFPDFDDPWVTFFKKEGAFLVFSGK